MLTKLKAFALAALLFVSTFFAARHYKQKSEQLERELKQEKGKTTNYERQVNAAYKNQSTFDKEIDDALESGEYLDYFDDD